MPDKKKKKYNISALTWNVANKNPPKETMEQLANEFAKAKPDILLVSLQEAKTSWLENENIGQRIFKRLNFITIYSDYFNVLTKPKKLTNWLHIAETNLVIGIKPKLFKNNEVSVEHYHSGKERPNRMNKGGLYTSIRVGNSRIGVISVHLESYSEENRKREIDALMNHFPSHQFDQVIFAGDLNERLESNIMSDNMRNSYDGLHASTANEISEYLIEKYDPISNGNSHLTTEHKMNFERPREFTYQEVDDKGNIKNKEGRNNRPDCGAFDTIGYKDNNSQLKVRKINNESISVVTPTKNGQENGKAISDHNAVIVHFELQDRKKLAPLEKLRRNLEDNITNERFELFLGSSHKVIINNKEYQVPERIKLLYEVLMSNEANQDKIEIIQAIQQSAKNYQSPKTIFGVTTTYKRLDKCYPVF